MFVARRKEETSNWHGTSPSDLCISVVSSLYRTHPRMNQFIYRASIYPYPNPHPHPLPPQSHQNHTNPSHTHSKITVTHLTPKSQSPKITVTHLTHISQSPKITLPPIRKQAPKQPPSTITKTKIYYFPLQGF